MKRKRRAIRYAHLNLENINFWVNSSFDTLRDEYVVSGL